MSACEDILLPAHFVCAMAWKINFDDTEVARFKMHIFFFVTWETLNSKFIGAI